MILDKLFQKFQLGDMIKVVGTLAPLEIEKQKGFWTSPYSVTLKVNNCFPLGVNLNQQTFLLKAPENYDFFGLEQIDLALGLQDLLSEQLSPFAFSDTLVDYFCSRFILF